jgi:[ribosomal protein S5]-alanine N-acetyltransferase
VSRVELRELELGLISEVTAMATKEASPPEVMPSEEISWSDDLCGKYAVFLRSRLPLERSWVVVVAARVAGVIRLQPQSDGSHEVGVWLGRRWRNQGLGTEALCALQQLVRKLGVRRVLAETTQGNVAAMRLVQSQGAALSVDKDGNAVHARWDL